MEKLNENWQLILDFKAFIQKFEIYLSEFSELDELIIVWGDKIIPNLGCEF